MKRLFERAEQGDREAAVEVDIQAYMATIDVAVLHKWAYGSAGRGRELFRHVSRLALARHLDPALWSECRSCVPGERMAACTACRGTGSLLIHSDAFSALVEPLGLPPRTWASRIAHMAEIFANWKQGRAAA